MRNRTKTRRRAHSAAIEALESRQYFSLFLNNIDSNNLGKGMWAWTLSTSMTNDGFSTSNFSGWFSYLRNTMHLDYVITKAGNGDSLNSQYTSTVVNAAHAAGLKIVPYFYLYGDAAQVKSPDTAANHHSTAEAAVFNQVFNAGGPGGDFAIFDIESEYGDTDSAGLINYFSRIGKSAAGDGSGSRDRLFMAYSSFDILHFHNTQFPVATIADYCDVAMPQMYWYAHGYSVATDISTTDADYKNTALVGVNGVKPVIPTGQSYDSSTAGDGTGLPPGTGTNSINDFYTQIKADTGAVSGGISGYRYKSINYFDQHSLDRKGTGALITPSPGEKTEIAAETIGDLPGVATVTSPTDGATSQPASGLVLNWSDVVNTYGTGSVGAALYYDVYLDNLTTPAATISYSAPTAPVSQWTIPSTLSAGTHQWKIVARNMFGSTSSAVWSFSVAAVLPGPFVNLSPSDGATLTTRPVTFDWSDSSGAVGYDFYFGANPTPTFSDLTSSTVNALGFGSSGAYTWHVVAKNANGTYTGATWGFTLDATAPTATLGNQLPVTGGAFLDFTVTYADTTAGVDFTTLDGSDVTVSGPNGYSAAASFVSVDNASNGTPRVATYRIAAPGGFWNDSDNGSYTVTQVAGQVKDVVGNARAAGTIGTIAVSTLGTAWLSGTTLNVAFDGTAVPLLLSTDSGNVRVTKNGNFTDFPGVTSISILGSSADDRLQINAPLTPPMSFVNSAGNDLIEVLDGAYVFDADIATASKNIGLYVSNTASVTFNSDQHLRSLSVDGTATLAVDGNRVLWVTDLAVTGQLNLCDNDLIWDYTAGSPIGAWAGSAYDGLTGLITQARAAGTWTGNGVATNRPAAMGSAPLTNLGVAEASDVLNYSGATAMFAGETVDATAVLVKYTYTADANLSGSVNGDDYFLIDSWYNSGSPSYLHGDFDLNGRIDADDYFLIDSIYSHQGTFL